MTSLGLQKPPDDDYRHARMRLLDQERRIRALERIVDVIQLDRHRDAE